MSENTRLLAVLAQVVAFSGVVFVIGYTAAAFRQVPPRVPMRFDLSGAPRAWAGRWALWIMPVATCVILAGMTLLNPIFNPAVLVSRGGTQTPTVILLTTLFVDAGIIWTIAFATLRIVRTALGLGGGPLR